MIKNEYDVIVVGAGPAGSVAAEYAAKEGVSVILLEKDRDVGYPVRCAEAINKKGVERFIKPNDKWINAYINKFTFVAPNGTVVEIPFDEVQGYVLERRIFDYELAKQASSFGAEVITRTYVYGLLMEGDNVCGVKVEYRGEKIDIKSKVVIAADGVESRVGRWAGLKTHIDFREMESCFQITASNVNIDQNALCFYFGKNIAPGGYFWAFPKGENTANIGLGISGMDCKKRSSLSYLNENVEKFFKGSSILTQIAGGVPCSAPLKKIYGKGIMLAGDAARQVNPLSGGGISSGMIGGSMAGKVAGKAVRKNDLSYISNYEKEWNAERGKLHLRLERLKNGVFDFSDDELNYIAKKINEVPANKRSLNRLFMIALANKPSLLVDVAKVFFV